MLDDVEHEVELGRMLGLRETFDLETGHLARCLSLIDPLMVERHLKERLMAEAALWLQRLDQLFKRQVLMRLSGERGLPHLV